MKIIKSINQIKNGIKRYKRNGKLIGFVPTMGCLHKGHLSLAYAARRECDIVVMSIFVNPAQFGPREDFKRYPRNIKRDERLAKKAGVEIIFYPSVKTMYPEGYSTFVNVEGITTRLCGAFRPGYFRGVVTVVTKLFNIVEPDIAYFGQKDAQQAIVIKRMVKDLNMDIKIKILPIVRESSGLAMSSRNVYLSTDERRDANILFIALQEARRMIKLGVVDSRRIIERMRSLIKSKPSVSKIDYIKIVDLERLLPVNKIKNRVLIVFAVWFGETRLIDNIIVDAKK